MSLGAFRQIAERASRNAELFEVWHQCAPGAYREPSTNAPRIDKVAIVVVPDKDGIHEVIARNVAPDHEFLTAICPPLEPVAAALSVAIRAGARLATIPSTPCCRTALMRSARCPQIFPNIELRRRTAAQFHASVPRRSSS